MTYSFDAKALEKPAFLGYRMPAEWEEHRATWITWPHNRNDWPGKFAAIPLVYAEIVRHLQAGEKVCIIVKDAAAKKNAAQLLDRSGVDLQRIEFHRMPSNRAWTRDHGPIYVVRARGPGRGRGALKNLLAITDWRFNAWAKYPNWRLDDRIPSLIAGITGTKLFQPSVESGGKPRRVVLEGGSIDVNGEGYLLTTEECLLSPVQARNPGLSKREIEEALRDHLGAFKTLWLGEGIAGDDTHGHIDDLARFVGPSTIVAASEANRRDPNHRPLQENHRRLREMTDERGKPFEIVTLPMPRPLFYEGVRLPASYLNFYIANGRVLVPTFNDPADRLALGKLAELFPGREVAGIHCVELVWGFGTIHCMTQQEPAV